MEQAARIRAKSYYIAGIGWDLRLEQDDVKHENRCRKKARVGFLRA